MPAVRTQKMLMECTACTARETATLHELDSDTLQTTGRLLRHCKHCLQDTPWQIASHSRSGPSASAPAPTPWRAVPRQPEPEKKERRRQRRCKAGMTGCIRHGGDDEVVKVLEASRDGVRFLSAKRYILNTWVELAVPYLPGSSNIFVSGRIVWHGRTPEGPQVYGLKYDH